MNESAAVDLALARLKGEEGCKPHAYNDATGQTVTCLPGGNLTIGYGLNLETGLDQTMMEWLLFYKLQLLSIALAACPWYVGCDDVRKSVLLDMGFNLGLHGLMGFHEMIAALQVKNWAAAAAQVHVSNPVLAGRYAHLSHIMLTGVA